MASPFSSDWLLYFIPALFNLGLKESSINWQNFCLILLAVMSFGAILRWLCPGGWAWGNLARRNTIPGPRGWPVMGNLLDMGYNAHRKAVKYNAMQLMSMSLGNTRLIVAFKPEIARELLNHSAFADRPLKQSAQQLLFGRAIGFAPYGDYWRNLRRIASNNLFSPHRIAASAKLRQAETTQMVQDLLAESSSESDASLCIRPFLQRASLNNLLGSVFGKRLNFSVQSEEAEALQAMVREGFELLGAFNWADHLPFLRSVDPHDIHSRCSILVPKVKSFVQNIIDEHRKSPKSDSEESDFVDVLLSLEDKLQDDDMVAVLWEMIFRGTDTTAILAEWILAEISLHPEIQAKLHEELDAQVGKERMVEESDIPKLKFMQAVVKETLRMHPPGPLLSWARLSNVDTKIGGHFVPAGTTAMVNMWSICHDEEIWAAGRRVFPGREKSFLVEKSMQEKKTN